MELLVSLAEAERLEKVTPVKPPSRISKTEIRLIPSKVRGLVPGERVRFPAPDLSTSTDGCAA